MIRITSVLRVTCVLAPLLVSGASSAQVSATSPGLGFGRPIEGATGGLSKRSGSLGQSDLSLGVRVHLDPYGKRCVAVDASSHVPPDFRKIFSPERSAYRSEDVKDKNDSSESVAPKLFEHVISADNHCALTIKLRVCYYGSLTCVPLDVPGYGRQRTILGVSSGGPDFRYQYTEQF